MRTSTAMSCAILTLAAAGLLGSAGASTAADNSSEHGRVLTLIASNGQTGPIGDPGASFGAGFQFYFRNSLTRNGSPFGREVGMCTVVEFSGPGAPVSFLCPDVLDLPDGQISTQTLTRDDGSSAPIRGAITGGTGRYRSARGQVLVTNLDDNRKQLQIQFS